MFFDSPELNRFVIFSFYFVENVEEPGAVVGLRDGTAFVVYDTVEWNNVDRSIFCTGSPWISNSGDPVERVRPRPPLRTGSSGVGSEEPKTWEFCSGGVMHTRKQVYRDQRERNSRRSDYRRNSQC